MFPSNGGPKFGGQSPNFSGFCGPKGPPTRATVEQSTKDRRRVKLLVPLLWSSLTVVLTDPVDFFESLGSLEHHGAFWMFKAKFREHVDKRVYPNGTHQNPLKSHIRSLLFLYKPVCKTSHALHGFTLCLDIYIYIYI